MVTRSPTTTTARTRAAGHEKALFQERGKPLDGSARPAIRCVARSDVLSYWGTCRYHEPVYLAGRRHADDDLVDVVDLFVASLGQDVLAGGVLGLGQLSPPDDALVEVVVGDDGGLAVDPGGAPLSMAVPTDWIS